MHGDINLANVCLKKKVVSNNEKKDPNKEQKNEQSESKNEEDDYLYKLCGFGHVLF
jgi:hypothetical protein